jgi:hypothetical protein
LQIWSDKKGLGFTRRELSAIAKSMVNGKSYSGKDGLFGVSPSSFSFIKQTAYDNNIYEEVRDGIFNEEFVYGLFEKILSEGGV